MGVKLNATKVISHFQMDSLVQSKQHLILKLYSSKLINLYKLLVKILCVRVEYEILCYVGFVET